MVVVPSGSFLMGDIAGGGSSRERPVTIPEAIAVGRYEVTVGQFREFVDETGICRYGNIRDDTYRSNTDDTAGAQCDDGSITKAPVGSYQPNEFGLYDMTGNVYEWTQDCWNNSYSGSPTNGSAWMSGDCGRHTLRGGSWAQSPLGFAFRVPQ